MLVLFAPSSPRPEPPKQGRFLPRRVESPGHDFTMSVILGVTLLAAFLMAVSLGLVVVSTW